jgi:branched-chain amino acid transport system ATP-binding protein
VIVRALGDQIAALKREGLTILLSEQNLKFAARLADRAYIIEKGEIRFDGPMRQLMADEALRRKYLTV